MMKFRILLVIVAMFALMLIGNAYYWVPVSNPNDASVVPLLATLLAFPAPFMVLSAVVMLAFSFLKVEEQNGQLVYDPRNPYWRVMSRIYGWKEAISLCKAFWQTVWAIFVIGVVSGFAIMIWATVQSGDVAKAGWMLLEIVGKLALFFGGMAIFMSYFLMLIKFSTSSSLVIRYLARTFLAISTFGLVGAIGYALYQKGDLGFVSITILASGALLYLVYYLESLPKDNFLMQIYYAILDNYCPKLAPKTQAE